MLAGNRVSAGLTRSTLNPMLVNNVRMAVNPLWHTLARMNSYDAQTFQQIQPQYIRHAGVHINTVI